MKYLAVLGTLLITPGIVSAQVMISEIFYDAEGSDDGREWIEIYNGGSESIPLSSWRFTEAETNHKLKPINNDGQLPPGGYAIIVDVHTGFLELFPEYSGPIYDSSFSLSNTGEVLVLRDADLVDQDSVLYSKEWGAAGDGYSLQRVQGSWGVGAPTPGATNQWSTHETDAEEVDSAADAGETNTQIQSVVHPSDPLPRITAYAGERLREGVVGGPLRFEGSSLGLLDEPLETARYIWSFGDGGSGSGESTTHTYVYPGEYVVTLSVASGKYTASDRVRVTIVATDIVISDVGGGDNGYIALTNNSGIDIDLAGWVLLSGGKRFTIPDGTILARKNTIRFPAPITQLPSGDGRNISLTYPNGSMVTEYEKQEAPQQEQLKQKVVEMHSVEIPIQKVATAHTVPEKTVEEREVMSSAAEVNIPIEKEQVVKSKQSATLPHVNMAASLGHLFQPVERKKQQEGYGWWLAGVCVIVALGVVSYLFTGAKEENEAASYTIIEEE